MSSYETSCGPVPVATAAAGVVGEKASKGTTAPLDADGAEDAAVRLERSEVETPHCGVVGAGIPGPATSLSGMTGEAADSSQSSSHHRAA